MIKHVPIMTVKITITWSQNVFYNYFTLPCRRVKVLSSNESDIYISLKVLKFSSDV